MPKILFINTDSLVKSFVYEGSWPNQLEKSRTINNIYNALYSTKDARLLSIRESLNYEGQISSTPIASYHNKIIGTSWHIGANKVSYWFGDINSIINKSNLTDTEREKILLKARSSVSKGYVCYATGISLVSSNTNPISEPIQSISILFFKPILHYGTLSAIEQIKKQKIDLIYVSTSDEYTVLALSQTTGIYVNQNVSLTLNNVSITNRDTKLFCNSTPDMVNKLKSTYGDGTVVTIDKPLAMYWKHVVKANRLQRHL